MSGSDDDIKKQPDEEPVDEERANGERDDEDQPDEEQDAKKEPDEEPDESDDITRKADLPGFAELREAVLNAARRRFTDRPSLRRDGVAGLTTAINNVPDGMANGFLVGVNPVFGLYATMMGPLVGGIFSSTRLMVITTTAAASLTTSQVLAGVPSDQRVNALFTMVILVGLFMIIFGVLGLGQLLRFVSYSVMTGFLSGVAALLILSQIPTLTGYEPEPGNRVSEAFEVLGNLGEINLWALIVGLSALALAVFLPRTPVGNFGRLIAIVFPSAVLAFLGTDAVEMVRDVGEIPSGIPTPFLPSTALVTFELISGALAVSVVILVQGSGVSQSVPNPDGSRRRLSRDFIAQGAANIASGLFRGLPVGGSLSATALGVLSGARTRWAAIFAGLWMAIIVTVFPGLVAYVAMPALGSLLILAGASSIKPDNIRSSWAAGWPAFIAGTTTFLAMLFLPIQAAVGIGVVLSALLYVIRSSSEITVVELVEDWDGRIVELETPEKVQDEQVTVLDIYGSLFYAGARVLERKLPDVRGSYRPVVILRLRSQQSLGATLADVLTSYADKLEEVNGRLYLTGLSRQQVEQMESDPTIQLTGPIRIYQATSVLGESTADAVGDAEVWLVDNEPEGENVGGSEDKRE